MVIRSKANNKYLKMREWDGNTVTPTLIDSYWVRDFYDATNFEENEARKIREQLRVVFKKDDFLLIN